MKDYKNVPRGCRHQTESIGEAVATLLAGVVGVIGGALVLTLLSFY
jgi:hypothetical protein